MKILIKDNDADIYYITLIRSIIVLKEAFNIFNIKCFL